MRRINLSFHNILFKHYKFSYLISENLQRFPHIMAPFTHAQFQSCFNDWIDQQHQDLEELLTQHSTGCNDNEKLQLKLLADKSIKHFEEYSEKRGLMVQHDAPSFHSPSWCSSFENALFWIGGCRPSLSVKLVYSVCGSEQSDELLQAERNGNLAEISANQLQMITALHCKTVTEEERLSTRMGTLQDDIAEFPLKIGGLMEEWSEEVDHAIDAHCLALASIVKDADRLRLSTLKELMAILTPRQSVDLLLTTKKLHLSMHKWGKSVTGHGKKRS